MKKILIVLILSLIILLAIGLNYSCAASQVVPVHFDQAINEIINQMMQGYNKEKYLIVYNRGLSGTEKYRDYIEDGGSLYFLKVYLYNGIVSPAGSTILEFTDSTVTYFNISLNHNYKPIVDGFINVLVGHQDGVANWSDIMFGNYDDGIGYFHNRPVNMGLYIGFPYYYTYIPSIPDDISEWFYSEQYWEAYNFGFDDGYSDGYQNGINDALSINETEKSLLTFLGSIFGVIGSFFIYIGSNFTIFGISIFNIFILVFGIISLVVIIKFII